MGTISTFLKLAGQMGESTWSYNQLTNSRNEIWREDGEWIQAACSYETTQQEQWMEMNREID